VQPAASRTRNTSRLRLTLLLLCLLLLLLLHCCGFRAAAIADRDGSLNARGVLGTMIQMRSHAAVDRKSSVCVQQPDGVGNYCALGMDFAEACVCKISSPRKVVKRKDWKCQKRL
jgi:hypothetical protein